MASKITQTELLNQFVNNGITSGEAGNAKVVGNQFIHFDTPMLEREDNGFIFNESRYTDVTHFLQRKIVQALNGKEYKTVNKVVIGYKGSLKNFLK